MELYKNKLSNYRSFIKFQEKLRAKEPIREFIDDRDLFNMCFLECFYIAEFSFIRSHPQYFTLYTLSTNRYDHLIQVFEKIHSWYNSIADDTLKSILSDIYPYLSALNFDLSDEISALDNEHKYYKSLEDFRISIGRERKNRIACPGCLDLYLSEYKISEKVSNLIGKSEYNKARNFLDSEKDISKAIKILFGASPHKTLLRTKLAIDYLYYIFPDLSTNVSEVIIKELSVLTKHVTNSQIFSSRGFKFILWDFVFEYFKKDKPNYKIFEDILQDKNNSDFFAIMIIPVLFEEIIVPSYFDKSKLRKEVLVKLFLERLNRKKIKSLFSEENTDATFYWFICYNLISKNSSDSTLPDFDLSNYIFDQLQDNPEYLERFTKNYIYITDLFSHQESLDLKVISEYINTDKYIELLNNQISDEIEKTRYSTHQLEIIKHSISNYRNSQEN